MKWGFSPSQALNSDWSLELGRSVFVATRPPWGQLWLSLLRALSLQVWMEDRT